MKEQDEIMIALREQSEIDRRAREAKKERIRRVAADNPDLPLSALSERFATPESVISELIGGITPERRENAYLGYRLHHDGKRRRTA